MNTDRYRSKLILAPMVRAGTLPLRALAIRHGADLVYGESLWVRSILWGAANDVIFRTCPELEREQVVFQMGTNNAERAVNVGLMIENDVSGIDINFGCPKSFSISGGMGAALLTQPEKIKEIMSTLVARLHVPVTCKIRVLKDREATLELCKLIERTGVSALGVHGRQRDERPADACRHHEIAQCSRMLSIPVIANGGSGEISCFDDIARFKAATECSSVMLARAALVNPGIFNRQTGVKKVDRATMIRDYLQLCMKYEADFVDTKYVLQRILGDAQHSCVEGAATLAAATMREICAAWNIDLKDCGIDTELNNNDPNSITNGSATKKRSHELIEGAEAMLIEIPVKRLKTQPKQSPKTVLYEWCVRNGLQNPKYVVRGVDGDRCFFSFVTVDEKRYTSSKKHTNKKLAEQASALVALHRLDIRNQLRGKWEADT